MSKDIKKVKFNGSFMELKHTRNKPTSAFLQDVINQDGLIKKSFYWLEKSPKENFEIKYT